MSCWRVSSGSRRSTASTPIESICTEHNRNTTHIDEEFHHLERAENQKIEKSDLCVFLLRRSFPSPQFPVSTVSTLRFHDST